MAAYASDKVDLEFAIVLTSVIVRARKKDWNFSTISLTPSSRVWRGLNWTRQARKILDLGLVWA